MSNCRGGDGTTSELRAFFRLAKVHARDDLRAANSDITGAPISNQKVTGVATRLLSAPILGQMNFPSSDESDGL